MNYNKSFSRILKYSLIYLVIVGFVISFFARVMIVSNAEIHRTVNLGTTSSEEIDDTDYFYFSMVSYFTIGYGDYVPKSDMAKTVVFIEAVVSLVLNAFFTALIVLELMKPRDKIKIYHKIFIQKKHNFVTLPIKNYGHLLVDVNFKLEFSKKKKKDRKKYKLDSKDIIIENDTNYLVSITDSRAFFRKRKQLSIKLKPNRDELKKFIDLMKNLGEDEIAIVRVFVSGTSSKTGSKLVKMNEVEIQAKHGPNGTIEYDNVLIGEELHLIEKVTAYKSDISDNVENYQNFENLDNKKLEKWSGELPKE